MESLIAQCLAHVLPLKQNKFTHYTTYHGARELCVAISGSIVFFKKDRSIRWWVRGGDIAVMTDSAGIDHGRQILGELNCFKVIGVIFLDPTAVKETLYLN